MAEDLRLMPAIGAAEGRHVLDQPQHRHLQLAEHVQRLARIQQRHILRRRHHQRPRQLRPLRQRQLDIPRPRRQVDDQHIQLAPGHLPQQLLQGPHDHRPAPDDRLILLQHQANRHHRHAMCLQRLDDLAIRAGRPLRNPHHPRLARTVDIRIQQPHPPPLPRQCHGKVRRHGGFPHAPLPARHRDDPVHARNLLRAALLRRRMLPNLQAGRGRFRHRSMRRHHHLHRRDAGQGAHRRLCHRLHRPQRPRRLGAFGLDDETHRAALHRQRANHVARDKIPPAGQDNAGKSPQDFIFGNRHLFFSCTRFRQTSSSFRHSARPC